jgi:transposase
MKDLLKYRTCVANVNYHIVFSVKYRYKVLDGAVADFLKKTISDIATEKDFIIKAMEIGESDHIHLFISAHPKHSIGQIVKWIKGISGIKLFKKFPDLRHSLWRGQLWSHSYYVETIGSISEENIKRYIENQNAPHLSRR